MRGNVKFSGKIFLSLARSMMFTVEEGDSKVFSKNR